MPGWLNVALAGAAVAVGVVVIAGLIIWRCFCVKRVAVERGESLQDGIAKLHNPNHHLRMELGSRRKPKQPYNYHLFRRGVSTKPLFSWADHPSLVSDAVENGWSRFAFTNYMSSPSTKSALLGLCAVGENGKYIEPELSWEVGQDSNDYMQRVRLNTGLRKGNTSSISPAASSVIRAALPLPGPHLGNFSFPQEAYFEIKILACPRDDHESIRGNEGEKIKLIRENSNAKANSESLIHVTSARDDKKIAELKQGGKDHEGKSEAAAFSLGLTGGGFLPLKFPGSYQGSIGFSSSGSVHLDGIKLVYDSEKGDWGRLTDKVIGCGFDPINKKVYFTLDSELVHVIHCKSEEFGAPLYPTLAANIDITVLVNFGQSAFQYGPANPQRTPNPCFICPPSNNRTASLNYEDSKELFSMGRIDAQWLNRNTTTRSGISEPSNRTRDYDEESEADLFEIVLDSSSRRSPSPVLR